MLNPIKRLYKPKVASRSVNLSVSADAAVSAPVAECEVIEYDSVTGMEQWNDSLFVQDFEDSVVTVPGSLFEDSKPANHSTYDMVDPFATVGRHSA